MWCCFRTCRRWDQVWMKLLLVRNGALVLNLVLEFLHVCIQASSCVSSTCCSQHSITTTTTSHQHHLQYVASPVLHPARPSPVAAPTIPPQSTPGALAIWQPQLGCLHHPPAAPIAQTCALAFYNIHHHYHHPIRMCQCCPAYCYPVVSRNDLCS